MRTIVHYLHCFTSQCSSKYLRTIVPHQRKGIWKYLLKIITCIVHEAVWLVHPQNYRCCPWNNRLHAALFGAQCPLRSRAENILKDTTHSGYPLFDLLSLERRFSSTQSRAKRSRDCFYLWALNKMNVAAGWRFKTYFKCH